MRNGVRKPYVHKSDASHHTKASLVEPGTGPQPEWVYLYSAVPTRIASTPRPSMLDGLLGILRFATIPVRGGS